MLVSTRPYEQQNIQVEIIGTKHIFSLKWCKNPENDARNGSYVRFYRRSDGQVNSVVHFGDVHFREFLTYFGPMCDLRKFKLLVGTSTDEQLIF